MKKYSVLFFALAAMTICFCAETTSTANATPIHTHNHADALYRGVETEDTAGVVWQCRKCGARSYGRSTPSSFGCNGVMEERHIWERIS